MNENLFEIFRRSFPSNLGRTFIDRPDAGTFSYRDVLDLSGRMARVLEDLGVQPGDRVAAQVEKSAEAIMLYLGILRAGAAFLPLNTAYTAGEIRYFLDDAEPTLFVCQPDFEAPMRDLAREVGVPNVETMGEHSDGSLMARVAPPPRPTTPSSRAAGTIWPPFSTPPAPPDARRAPCSATATSPRTRQR